MSLDIEKAKTIELNPEATLRSRVMQDGFEIPPHSETIETKLLNELEGLASVFEQTSKPWFLIGGTSLDLHAGKIFRGHGDHDVLVYREDITDFLATLENSGYTAFNVVPDKEDTPATNETVAKGSNLHLYKLDKELPGPDFIDLWISDDPDAQSVTYSDNRIGIEIDIPVTKREESFKTPDGHSIPLQPKEFPIFNKIFGTRQIDLNDLNNFWPTMTKEERRAINGIIKSNRVEFDVSGTIVDSVEELIEKANQSTSEVKDKLVASQTDSTLEELNEKLTSFVTKTYQLAQASSAETFLKNIVNEFGDTMSESEMEVVNKAKDFYFQEPRPTSEEFESYVKKQVDLVSYAEQRLKRIAYDIPRWNVIQSKP